MAPTLSRAQLRRVVRAVMQRGVPEADAEDIVVRAYEKASRQYRRERGAFVALLLRAARNEATDWWRRQRREAAALAAAPARTAQDAPARQRAEENQRRLLERLTPREQEVFAVWALQRHLPQGALDATAAATKLGMTVAEFNNAKRRLRRRVLVVLNELSLSPRDLYSLQEDEGPRRKHAQR